MKKMIKQHIERARGYGPAFFRSERAIKEIEHPSRKTWNAYYKWRESLKK